MLVYINYPNPHITIHNDASCQQIQIHQKTGQRRIQIRPASLKSVLNDFIVDKHDFEPMKEYNDMWLDITLDSPDQEFGIVYVIQALLGQRYSPLANAPVNIHCK